MTSEFIWKPTKMLRYIRTVASSSATGIIQTDAGVGYIKAINNPQGPHVLACDWIGTQLARRFGLHTFDVAIIDLTPGNEFPLTDNIFAAPGSAFVCREELGQVMDGWRSLSNVENIGDIPRLIVFDTWVRNCDRYAPGLGRNGQARMNQDNVFLSIEGASQGKFILKAIDHGHIFTCGKPLNKKIAQIDIIREEKLYGLFPLFKDYVNVEQIEQASRVLKDIRSDLWDDLLHTIPSNWDVKDDAKEAINRFLLERARFLADHIHSLATKEIELNKPDFGLEEGK